MNDNILTLKDLKSLLITQEYLKFKQSINICKQYYSLEQQKKEEQCINQLNEFQEILKQKENKNEKQQEIYKAFEMAMQLTNEGKHEDALKLYDKSLPLFKIMDEIFRWKSQSLLYLQRIEEGIKCCDIAIYLNPQNDNAHNNKYNLNQYNEAIECYDKAIQLNPTYGRHFIKKAETLLALGKREEAKQCYQNALIAGNVNEDYIKKQLLKL